MSDAMNALISRTYRRMFDEASDDMKACIAAGVPMNYSWNGNVVTMTTENPVAVVREPSGRVTVFVGKNEPQEGQAD